MPTKKRYQVSVDGAVVSSFRLQWLSVLYAKYLSVDNATSRVTVFDQATNKTVFSEIWLDVPYYVE
jgi:hypothetical protein